MPLFVVTRAVPATHPREAGGVIFTFVTDGIASAIQQARRAAGAKDVNVIGSARTAQQCLKAGLADELHVDIMPVFLGGGLRPFDGIEPDEVRLGKNKGGTVSGREDAHEVQSGEVRSEGRGRGKSPRLFCSPVCA